MIFGIFLPMKMLGNLTDHFLSEMGFSQKSTLGINKMKSQSSGNFIEIRNMHLKELNVLFKMSIGSIGLPRVVLEIYQFFWKKSTKNCHFPKFPPKISAWVKQFSSGSLIQHAILHRIRNHRAKRSNCGCNIPCVNNLTMKAF